MHRCPTCKGEVPARDTNASFPFCSPRCRAVDLGRWFSGGYVVPGKLGEREGGEPTADEPQPPANGVTPK